jgi:hypothetical protein
LRRYNLAGQTSASFAMRCNYERCLLDFELHLAGRGLYSLTSQLNLSRF